MNYASRRILMPGLLLWFFSGLASAQGVEIFAKAAYSKTNLSADKYSQSISGSTGLGIALISELRLEGRYTVISKFENRLEIGDPDVVAVLTNMKTQTSIYSVGLDISPFGDKSSFQPFLYLGGGFVQTQRNWDQTITSTGETESVGEPKRTGIAGNLGLGFRMRLARNFAFEVEAFAYCVDPHKPGALIDIYGTAGIRIFL